MNPDQSIYVMVIAAGVEIEVSAAGWSCEEFPALAKVMGMAFPVMGNPQAAAEKASDRYNWHYTVKAPSAPELAVNGVS